MAGGGFASVLSATGAALAKTVGIVGDDLAVNTKQMIGTQNENKVLGAVALGSLANKAVLIGAALGLSALAPGLLVPLMALGGSYLCYEGVHKILHRKHEAEEKPATDKQKIKQAIFTDTILSSEIVIVALGAMAGLTLGAQAAALALVGVAMTAGVYGVVGGILKLDNLAEAMMKRANKAVRAAGRGLLKAVGPFIKTVGVVGTAAMFLVGGGMVMHAVPLLHGLAELGPLSLLAEAGVGVAAGLIAQPLVKHILAPPARFAKRKTARPRAAIVRGVKKVASLRPHFKKSAGKHRAAPRAPKHAKGNAPQP